MQFSSLSSPIYISLAVNIAFIARRYQQCYIIVIAIGIAVNIIIISTLDTVKIIIIATVIIITIAIVIAVINNIAIATAVSSYAHIVTNLTICMSFIAVIILPSQLSSHHHYHR